MATSSSKDSRLYWTAMTSWPSASRAGMILLKHEPSAQMPWQNTIVGLGVSLGDGLAAVGIRMLLLRYGATVMRGCGPRQRPCRVAPCLAGIADGNHGTAAPALFHRGRGGRRP